MSKHQVFIFGYYGWKNVGDDAMLYALLQELHSLNLEARFAVLSPIPVVVPPEIKSKIKFVKLSPFAVGREILASSAFLIGGGTHLFDYGSKRRALIIQLRILALILYSRLLGKKVYLLNNGLGPFSTAWGRFLPRLICHLAEYISVRDKMSYHFLSLWGLTDKASLAFDISTLIEPRKQARSNFIKASNKHVLGISVTPVFEIYHGSKNKDLLFIDRIAEQVNEWLTKDSRAEVYPFVFKGKSKDDDILITRLLQERLQPAERVKVIQYDPDPRSVLAQVAYCNAFVGMRYHACLFAYLNSIPLLIIDYHPKCGALANELGLSKKSVVSLDEIFNGQFYERLENLVNSPGDFRATLSTDMAMKRARNGIAQVKLS